METSLPMPPIVGKPLKAIFDSQNKNNIFLYNEQTVYSPSGTPRERHITGAYINLANCHEAWQKHVTPSLDLSKSFFIVWQKHGILTFDVLHVCPRSILPSFVVPSEDIERRVFHRQLTDRMVSVCEIAPESSVGSDHTTDNIKIITFDIPPDQVVA